MTKLRSKSMKRSGKQSHEPPAQLAHSSSDAGYDPDRDDQLFFKLLKRGQVVHGRLITPEAVTTLLTLNTEQASELLDLLYALADTVVDKLEETNNPCQRL